MLEGDGAASFTKEEMQQGKHTDYEKQLYDEMIAGMTSALAESEPRGPTEPVKLAAADREPGIKWSKLADRVFFEIENFGPMCKSLNLPNIILIEGMFQI